MLHLSSPINVRSVRVSTIFVLALALIVSLVGTYSALAATPTSTVAAQGSRFYPATGYSVGGAFLSFFDKYGGVRIFGYPISAEVNEGGMTVQYFERQRFEFHPENKGTQYEVLLGALGTEAARGKASLAPIPAVANTADRVYFRETGHTLSGAFLTFWRANGGIRVLGYPISEPATVNGYLTQYFERARMEYHPEKVAAGYEVELGHLGKEYLAAHPDPGVGGVPPVSTTPTGAQQLLALINSARQASGVKPVVVDSRIAAVSQSRSSDMASRNYFLHVTPEGKSFEDFLKVAGIRYKFGGEILSKNNFGADLAPGKAYDFFINSPAHKAIMLDARFTSAGVGEAKDAQGYYIYTVIFVQTP